MNFITLKELKKMVPVASEFKRVPGLKKILEDGIEVVLRKQMENHAEVVVYKNGYVSYHERSRKGSQDTTQEIEIYFNFLGRYIPPSLQPVPLTPEEQEELRKREERKDRLHQNYLKRKASGAQKRYEDKIKAKKKAEMDAKKALIRAEDMKKGVFSTIGQLPKEEPRKGSIAASAAV